MKTPSLKIGIAVLVFKNGRILFGKCRDEWHVPQGLLNLRDATLESAAARVVKDCGQYVVTAPQFLCYKSWERFRPVNGAKHSLYFTAIWKSGEGKEWKLDNKGCVQWDWFDLNLLPHPLFVSAHIFDKATLRQIRKVARQSK